MISTSGSSLNSLISFNESSGLNIAGTEHISETFGAGGTIKSNKGDPEIILHIKFKDNVNISGIMIEGSMNSDKNPTTMKLFANKTSLDFSDASTTASTETVDLKVNLGKVVTLKIAKFRNVSNLFVRFIFYLCFYFTYFFMMFIF